MRNSDQVETIFKIGAALVVTGAILLYKAFRRIRLARKIEDTGTIPAASAPQGLVELQGFAWPAEILPSPIDRRPSVYYKLIIEEERRRNKSTTWVTIHEEESQTPFFLVDNSGAVLIHPKGAQHEIKARCIAWKSLAASQKETLLTAIQTTRKGFTIGSGFFSSNVRVNEYVIYAGSPPVRHGQFQDGVGNISLQNPSRGGALY